MRNRQRLSLAEEAYSRIREKILRGEYPLGAPLSRRQLAAELGMSFLPVSEAMNRLEEQGLVESRPRVGTRVRVPTSQDLRDLSIMREALEAQSARLFAERASPEERTALRAMATRLDGMNEDTGTPDNPEVRFRTHMLHLGFHMRIAECSGCKALCDALDKNQVLVFNWLYDTAAHHTSPPGWHQSLMDALAGNDVEAADAAMRQHVRYGLGEIQAEIACRFGAHGIFAELKPSRRITGSGRRAWRAKIGS